MNKRRVFSDMVTMDRSRVLAFAVCAACFLAGALGGTAMARSVGEGGMVPEFLSGYMGSLREGGGLSAAAVLWDIGKYHLAVFLMGFSIPGLLGIPLVSLIRGFTLSFSIAVFTRLYSLGGAAAAAVLFGAAALLSVPLLLAVSAEALCASGRLLSAGLLRGPGGPDIYSKAYFLRFFAAAILLLLLSAGERALLNAGLTELPIFP